MDEAGKRKTRTEATSISRLSSDNITEILLRLPAKSVHRAGAVCKAWRRITTNTRFRADHARLQPTDVILYTYQFSPRCKDIRRRGYFEDELPLDLLRISSPDDDDEAARRRLIRYPKEITFLLLASCNGVLLFHKYKSKGTPRTFVLCNPTTSRWAELPRLPPPLREPTSYDYIDEYAFYFHEPSDEYRLLVRCEQRSSWFILATGAAEPREVDLHTWLPEMMGITNLLRTTPVALQGRLHWPRRQAAEEPAAAAAAAGESETGASTTTMVVFDTPSETFHLMAGPSTATAAQTKVFEMEGRLVAADFGDEEAEHVDLWFLEDYNAGRWERRHRAPAPWPAGTRMPEVRRPKSVAAAGDDREGTVMLGNHLGLLVYSLRTRTARSVDSLAASKRSVVESRHVFRESLVQHRSFAPRSADELGVNIFWN